MGLNVGLWDDRETLSQVWPGGLYIYVVFIQRLSGNYRKDMGQFIVIEIFLVDNMSF